MNKIANYVKPIIKNPFTLNSILAFIFKYNTLLVFLVMMVIASTVSDVFFTRTNIFNLLRQVAGLGIVGMGMLIVILTGGIDLSVGSIIAFTSVLSAFFSTNHVTS